MLKVAAAALAVPILALIYVTTALRRSTLARTGVAVGLGGILAIGVMLAGRPAPAAATPPTAILPLTGASFGPIVSTGTSLDDVMTITFTGPMDEGSVAALTTVSPPTPIVLAWDPAGTKLTIAPRDGWTPATFHTITVAAGALARNGQPLLGPVRTGFLTRGPVAVSVAPTARVGSRVAITTAFDVVFDRPMDPAEVSASIHLEPTAAGTVTMVGSPADGTRFRFTPTTSLRPDSAYRLVVSGLGGSASGAVPETSVAVRTVAAPTVVRFRPRTDTRDVGPDVTISVRFTAAMDPATTAKAFTVKAAGKAIAGAITFAEGDRVLVFKPAATLPYATALVMTVAASATAADGTPLASTARGTFETVAKPVARPAPKPASSGSGSGGSGSGGSGSGGSGGGAVGGGSWGAVETYYLGLMNCTRTGGWVTSSGSCSSPGGRDVAALRLDSGISSKVSRPYAKRLATGGDCSHFMGGTPGDRLSAAGYSSYRWAENIGCRSGDPRGAVLGSHLFFQDEKSTNGGHYVNLMNAAYDRVGIGVWVSSGRVRLVIDFYHP